MHINSLDAYGNVHKMLGPWQAEVLRAIKLNQPCTRQDLVPIVNKPINSITGRVRELLDAGLIEEAGARYFQARPRALLRAVKVTNHRSRA